MSQILPSKRDIMTTEDLRTAVRPTEVGLSAAAWQTRRTRPRTIVFIIAVAFVDSGRASAIISRTTPHAHTNALPQMKSGWRRAVRAHVLVLAACIHSAPGGSVSPSARVVRWFEGTGAQVSDCIQIGRSEACGGGSGILARRQLAPLETLVTAPLSSCLSAASALEDAEIGAACAEYLAAAGGELAGAEAVVVAAMLVHVRASPPSSPAGVRWGPYVNTLPWGRDFALADEGEGDSLAHHPLLLEGDDADGPPGDAELLREHRADAAASADAVHALLKARVPWRACFRAVVIVASRTFDFTVPLAAYDAKPGVKWAFVMVPVLDNLNHPSRSALEAIGEAGERFRRTDVLGACVRWRMDEKEHSEPWVSACAPTELRVEAGDELWQWYGNAGWAPGAAHDPQAWRAGEAKFRAQYGFSPWE